MLTGLALVVLGGACCARSLPPDDEALLSAIEIPAERLMPLALDTAIVEAGQPRAIICHADAPAWREAALVVREAIAQATGARLRVVTDAEISPEEMEQTNAILLGHLDNNRHVARLYHNFFVCLDQGYTGREGYVLRSVHDPWGLGHNYLLVGGSFPEGTARAARAFAKLVAGQARGNSLTIGRLLELQFDPTDRAEPITAPLSEAARDEAIATGLRLFKSPGQGRSAVSRLVDAGGAYHRTGDPRWLEVYHGLMAGLLDYYENDEYVNSGLARYDNDFRDAWTYEVGVLWDLIEESGAFSDAERLAYTNLVLRLAYECVRYQGYDRPDVVDRWRNNQDVVHNHNTFPALGVYFVGNYLKRHYQVSFVDDWLTCARGIFQGQRHCPKPQEDAASYQWLPMIHTMVYGLAEGDTTYFDEGHARETARVGMMVMDNAGWECAFGDHDGYKGASAIQTTLNKIAWYYQDPQILWCAQHADGRGYDPLGQRYYCAFSPQPPTDHVGISVSRLPQMCYDFIPRSASYPTKPNLPLEETFDKLVLRQGLQREDEYLLLDGFGRGNHMHFDANAIIRYAAGGEPLLVDGEYIRNAPKYHNSLVIIRDGQAELCPAVAGLAYAHMLDGTAFTRTYLTDYNGTRWTRNIAWVPGDYLVVVDEVEALSEADYTLRCCWRPWGEATLEGNRLTVAHPPMRLTVENPDPGVSSRLEHMKTVERLPIWRLSQQVGRHLRVGDKQRFVNLVCSRQQADADEPRIAGAPSGFRITSHGASTALLLGGEIALPQGRLRAEADLLLANEGRIGAAGCTLLAGDEELFKSSVPVAIELAPGAGSGVLVTDQPASVQVRIGPNSTLNVDSTRVTADGVGMVRFEVGEGRHTLRCEPFPMPPLLASLGRGEQVAAPREVGAARLPEATLSEAWRCEGFEPAAEVLPVQSVTCDQPWHDIGDGRYGPFEKLVDGQYSSSTTSVMWQRGVTPTIVLDLGQETEVKSVVTREWHMNTNWDVGERRLEISSDGFVDDVRAVGPFVAAGTESFGGNVNSLFEVPVAQRARELRLTVTPARPDASVYLAEIEVHGIRPGALPGIRALARGDLTGDGTDELVLGSGAGQVTAMTADGTVLWTWQTERAAINAIACADVNRDGRAEVIFGGDAQRLGLLSADGRELWTVNPPQFRGIRSDVMTVLPADINGDGLPEIVCGVRSWQYFAYSGEGKMIWRNVIYAHSATVGHADDFDGDGLPEIVGGNAYYTLNLIDNDGKRIFSAGRLGPEQTAISSADTDGDGTPDILAGVDDGTLLCFGTDRKTRWSANLGDRVTRLVPRTVNGELRIFCAAESANVFALNGAGEVVWRAPLADGATDLAVGEVSGRTVICSAGGNAGLYVLDAEGQLLGRAATEGAARQVVIIGGRALVTTSTGLVQAFDLPRP